MRGFRAKDADRDRCVELIEAAYVDGQINDADRELRVGRALSAETLDELATLTRDLSEYLPALVQPLRSRLGQPGAGTHRPTLAYHPPCTLQHGQQLRGGVEGLMRELGFEISLAPSESHLCCGSAGTYSVLQPVLSKQLRERKLAALAPLAAEAIVSANIGCIQHLQSGTDVPVRHWVEVLDEALLHG